MRQLWAIRTMQRCTRGLAARMRVSTLRINRAASLIQTCYRRYSWVKKRAKKETVELSGKLLNRVLRGWLVLCRWHKLRKAVITLQNRLRKRRAKAVLKNLRLANRDVHALRLKNQELQELIVTLKNSTSGSSMRAINTAHVTTATTTTALHSTGQISEIESLNKENESLKREIESLNKENGSLKHEIESLKNYVVELQANRANRDVSKVT